MPSHVHADLHHHHPELDLPPARHCPIRMRTQTITIYRYDELTPKAQEKARAWWRDSGREDTHWSDIANEEAREQGVFLGLDITKIYFSGFWSQGDGACFEGTWRADRAQPDGVANGWGACPALGELLRIAVEFKKLAEKYPKARFTVRHRGHYSHEYCTEFDVDLGWDGDDNVSDAPEDDGTAEKEIMAAARWFMRWIYKQLEASYDDYNSDESVADAILSSDHEFTVDGKHYRG